MNCLKIHSVPLLCMLALLVTFPTLAQETGYMPFNSEVAAKGLLCDTFGILKGDLGLILGLVIGFLGYLIITTKQMNVGGFVMIIVGVCLTAFPDLFITTLNGIVALSNGIFSQTTITVAC